MIPFTILLKKVGKVFRRLTVGLMSTAVAVIVYGTFSEYYIERNYPQSGIHSLFTSFWWTMQTLTTVGYGDVTIYGTLGKLNAILIMVVGIGSLGLFLASTSATLANVRLKQRVGMMRVKMKEHVIVCNYEANAAETVRDIAGKGVPVVIVSEKDVPEGNEVYEYVRGSCLDDETLDKAGIKHSNTAVILAGEISRQEEAAKVDAMSILMAMKIKKKNPNIFVVAEILLSKSMEHAEYAGVDEPIVRGSISRYLISRSVVLPGLSKALTDIVAESEGLTIGEEDGASFEGIEFGNLTDRFMKSGKFVIGLRKGKRMIRDLRRNSVVSCDSVIFLHRKA